MPPRLQSFVSQYFPEIAVKDYTFADGIYHVTLDNSAYLEFNSAVNWILIDGRGSTLPQELLYDQLPEKFYDYLGTTGALTQVFSMARNSSIITLSLLDSTAVYDIATGDITE